MKIFTNDAMVYHNHYNVTHLVLPMMTPSGLSIGTILKTKRSLRALATWELPVYRLYKRIYTGKNVFHNHQKARSLWCGQVKIAIIMINTREELDGSSHIIKELIHIIKYNIQYIIPVRNWMTPLIIQELGLSPGWTRPVSTTNCFPWSSSWLSWLWLWWL